jgi:hypothetical protein
MAGNALVLALFPSELAADTAVASLKSWDRLTDDVKLGAIGVLVADRHGRIKEHKLGARATKKGAGIGLVLAVLAPATLLAGLIGGGTLGRFYHKGLGLTSEDRHRIGDQLAGGHAAVGVLVSEGESAAVAARLVELGGTSEIHDVSDEALVAVQAAAGGPGPMATEPWAAIAQAEPVPGPRRGNGRWR